MKKILVIILAVSMLSLISCNDDRSISSSEPVSSEESTSTSQPETTPSIETETTPSIEPESTPSSIPPVITPSGTPSGTPPESSSPPPVSSSSSTEKSSSTVEGEVFGVGTNPLLALGVLNDVAGSSDQLSNWNTTFDDSKEKVSSLLITERSASAKKLTDEQAQLFLDTIAGLSLNSMDTLGNPPSSSIINVMAVDSSGNRLWRISLSDTYLCVISSDNSTSNWFDSSSNDVNDLFNILA